LTTHPTAAELTAAAAGFIGSVAPKLGGREAFLAKVAVNALAAVERELTLGPAAREAATLRLTALLGREGDFEALNGELCERLASGAVDLTTPGVLAHLKASTIDQVRIDQPTYSGLRQLEGTL
jgi:hypothetical protein